MTKFQFLKFVHVLAAVIWVGGAFLILVLTVLSRRASVQYRHEFAKAIRGATWIFDLSSVLVLGFGIWMVLDADPYGFDQAWILIGIAGLVLSVLFGLYVGPADKKMVARYEAGDSAAGDALLERIWKVSLVYVAFLLFVIWAMVAKPGL